MPQLARARRFGAAATFTLLTAVGAGQLPIGPAGADPVTYALTLSPADSTSLVRHPQILTAHLQRDTGSGPEDVAGETLTFSLVGEGAITDVAPGDTLVSCVTPADGRCALTINSHAGGVSTLIAAFEPADIIVLQEIRTADAVQTAEATHQWVDYRLTMTPPGPIQDVGEDQTMVVTLERSASPFGPAPSRTVELILTGVGHIVSVNGVPGSVCTTNTQGQCSVVVTSDDDGGTDLTARFSAPEDGEDPIYTALGVITWKPIYGNDPGVGYGYGDDPYGYGGGRGINDPDPFANDPVVEPAADTNTHPVSTTLVGGETLTQDPSAGVAGAGDPGVASAPFAAGAELPRTGARHPIGKALLALGLIGAGLAGRAVGRRRLSTTR